MAFVVIVLPKYLAEDPKCSTHQQMLHCTHAESIIGVQWGQKNPNPRGHRSSGKRGLPSFPLNGGPEGWDFSGTTEHQ